MVGTPALLAVQDITVASDAGGEVPASLRTLVPRRVWREMGGS
jgi:hypothetical protein